MADTFYEVPLYWIESAIHPAGPALPVTAHVVIHLHAQGRMILQIPEHIFVCLESKLIWTLIRIGFQFVVTVLQILCELATGQVASTSTALSDDVHDSSMASESNDLQNWVAVPNGGNVQSL
jgi:hypothetical protein